MGEAGSQKNEEEGKELVPHVSAVQGASECLEGEPGDKDGRGQTKNRAILFSNRTQFGKSNCSNLILIFCPSGTVILKKHLMFLS